MAGNKQDRSLKLTFRGESFKNGLVPLMVVATKLQALQNLVFHAAATASQFRGARRGQWFNKFQDTAELIFLTSHHSDLVIEAELAGPETFLAEESDVGKKAMDLVFELGGALADGRLDQMRIARDDREFLLRAMENLMPGPTDDYEVELENCSAVRHPKLTFTASTRKALRRLMTQGMKLPYAGEEVTIIGELTKIHVDSSPQLIAVRQKGTEIECYYPDAMRDQIANLLAGSMVEVTGQALMDPRGQLVKIDPIFYDVETISLEPLRLTRFEYEGNPYRLKEPLLVEVEYADNRWIYHNDQINLWGYGARREDAVHDLHANFDYIWHEFALEEDGALDEKAQEIKKILRSARENVKSMTAYAPPWRGNSN